MRLHRSAKAESFVLVCRGLGIWKDHRLRFQIEQNHFPMNTLWTFSLENKLWRRSYSHKSLQFEWSVGEIGTEIKFIFWEQISIESWRSLNLYANFIFAYTKDILNQFYNSTLDVFFFCSSNISAMDVILFPFRSSAPLATHSRYQSIHFDIFIRLNAHHNVIKFEPPLRLSLLLFLPVEEAKKEDEKKRDAKRKR